MPSRNREQPNILFILSDDMGAWAMQCAGNSEIATPHLDRLAATGVRFRNFFCTSPVCSPARASIFTGRIPSQHGVHDWIRAGNSTIEPDRAGILIRYLEDQPGYPDLLARNGYTCGLSGKWHLGDAHHPQMSFSFWEVHAKGGGPYCNAPMIRNGEVREEPRYVTDVITDNAIRFLAQEEKLDRPFYLSVHYTAPHSPWARVHHPADIYDDYHQNCPFLSVPFEPLHPNQINSCEIGRDDRSRRDLLSGYYAAVTVMDRNIGRILDWLEARNLRSNTLILFMSDNGMNMGHHGIWGKGNGTYPLNLFDTSVKVPMLVSRPGHVPQGKTSHELLSQYDILPTLLDYLRLPPSDDLNLPGHTFAPVLRGAPSDTSCPVIVFDEYGPSRMIRTREWKYIHRYPDGPHEFYDLQNDPDEKTDLVRDLAHSGRIQDLKRELDQWFARYVNPSLDGARHPVTGKGQLDLVGPRATLPNSFASDVKLMSRP